jgi:hypothetical protein
MDAGTFHICQGCRERVEQGSPDVIVAFEQVDVTAMTQGYRERRDGMRVLFHEQCSPYHSGRYRLDPAA